MNIFLTGIFTIRNAFEASYPFIESILSIYPITDEFLISDGYSIDGTYEYLKRLESIFPKIRLYQYKEYRSKCYESMDETLKNLMDKAKGEWIVEIQADEGYHEKDLMNIKQILLNNPDIVSIRQERIDIWNFNFIGPRKNTTVRIFRNKPDLRFVEGGDRLIGDNILPELEISIPFYHFPSIIPDKYILKARRHAFFLTTSDIRKNVYLRRKKALENGKLDRRGPPWIENIPVIFKGIREMNEYKVREELFNIEWLEKLTGLKYE